MGGAEPAVPERGSGGSKYRGPSTRAHEPGVPERPRKGF